jgi:group I intron endonuclease
LRLGKSHNKHLQRAWGRYGEEAFDFVVLEQCEPNECLAREQHYIVAFGATNPVSGYNISPTAGSQFGFRHSEESKAKVAANHRMRDPEARRRHSEILRGRKPAREIVERRAASLKRCYAEGRRDARVVPDDVRRRISATQKGRKISHELLLKRIGRKTPEETKRKMSLAHLGKKHTPEHIAKTSGELHHGAKLSLEDIQKIRSLYRRYSKEYGGVALGKMFGVHPSNILLIVSGKAWKN